MRRDREHTCVTKEKLLDCAKWDCLAMNFTRIAQITFLTQRMLCSFCVISSVSCHSVYTFYPFFFFFIFNIKRSLLNKKKFVAPILSNFHARICVCSNFKFIQKLNSNFLKFHQTLLINFYTILTKYASLSLHMQMQIAQCLREENSLRVPRQSCTESKSSFCSRSLLLLLLPPPPRIPLLFFFTLVNHVKRGFVSIT